MGDIHAPRIYLFSDFRYLFPSFSPQITHPWDQYFQFDQVDQVSFCEVVHVYRTPLPVSNHSLRYILQSNFCTKSTTPRLRLSIYSKIAFYYFKIFKYPIIYSFASIYTPCTYRIIDPYIEKQFHVFF